MLKAALRASGELVRLTELEPLPLETNAEGPFRSVAGVGRKGEVHFDQLLEMAGKTRQGGEEAGWVLPSEDASHLAEICLRALTGDGQVRLEGLEIEPLLQVIRSMLRTRFGLEEALRAKG